MTARRFAALAFVLLAVVVSLPGLVWRLRHPEATETQALYRWWPSHVTAFVCVVAAWLIADRRSS